MSKGQPGGSSGFVAVYRRLLDHPLWTQLPAEWLKAWLYLLLRANHKPCPWWDGMREIEIPAGGLVTSIEKLATSGKISTRQARGSLDYFEKTGMVTRQASNRHSIITITNWASYQFVGSTDDTPDDRPDDATMTSRRHPGRQANVTQDGNSTTNKQLTREESSSSADEGANGLPSMDALPFDTLDEIPPERSLSDLQEDWFAEFWAKYPRKVDRADALKAFRKHATSEEKKNQIVRGLEKHLPALLASDKKYRPHAATWLNKRRYEEDPEGLEPQTNHASQQGPRRAAYHQKWTPPTGEVSNG